MGGWVSERGFIQAMQIHRDIATGKRQEAQRVKWVSGTVMRVYSRTVRGVQLLLRTRQRVLVRAQLAAQRARVALG